MKKLLLFLTTTMLVYSGGDITVVTPYETYDEVRADEEAVEYIEPISTPQIEEEVVPETEYIMPEATPAPVVPTPEPVVEVPSEAVKPAPVPVPVPVPTKSTTSTTIKPNGFYTGIGISGTRYDNSCECNKASGVVKRNHHEEKSFAIMARLGYDFNQYIGLEARGVKDVAGDDGASVSHAGVFIKPMYPITKDLNIYGLIGMAKTKTSGDYPKVNSESLALGGGIEYDLSREKPKNGKYNRVEILMGQETKRKGLDYS